jgi:2'-5' RNA ligase
VSQPPAEGDAAIRAFFAVDLDGAVRRAASEVAHALRVAPGGDRVRWVRPEGLHVTLRFLGNIETGQIPPLLQTVREQIAGLRPFRIQLGAAHPFPSARRPHVVVLEVAPAEPLAELAEAVERGVVAAGFAPEPRPFRAHLTLGRVRGRRFPSATASVAPEAAACDVEEAVLFRSDLHRSGARYTPLERIPLGSSPVSFTP